MGKDEINSQTFLEMRAVNVARGDRVVLHDVNLNIRTGEHVAILGPNGCGKSTLILAMTCQLYPGPWALTCLASERPSRPVSTR